jgi:hypothetical protein
MVKRPGYREAVEWLAGNDDCYWLADTDLIPSVCACMVRDLFDVDESKLYRDIRRAIKRVFPDHPAAELVEGARTDG